MAHNSDLAASSVTSALRTLSRPWPLMVAGLACTVIGLLFTLTSAVPARLLFLAAGLVIAGSAVARRLQTASWELEDRVESAGLLALGAFVALLAFFGMDENWDSGRVFLGVLIGVALGGSAVILLPRVGRRIVASLLVLLHFGGILTAVTAVPPRLEAAPWLSMQLWTHFYRHYLTFAYLTNAYHFYSPDPGPPTLLWFRVQYDDDTYQWIKLPNRQESPVGLHHQRLLALAESTNSPILGRPLATDEVIKEWEKTTEHKYEIVPGIKHESWQTLLRRRQLAVNLSYSQPIVMADAPLENQYSEPQEIAKRLIMSYARHIARTSPNPEHPEVPVKYVRVYRITHNLISPRDIKDGVSPLKPTFYIPIYMGKYDTNGKLLDPKDPFLFWYLPIIELPGSQKVLNCLEIHANETDRVQKGD